MSPKIGLISRKHGSRDAISFGPKMPRKTPETIMSHGVLEPKKPALLASHDAILSSQICGWRLQKVLRLGDGRRLPIKENFATINLNLFSRYCWEVSHDCQDFGHYSKEVSDDLREVCHRCHFETSFQKFGPLWQPWLQNNFHIEVEGGRAREGEEWAEYVQGGSVREREGGPSADPKFDFFQILDQILSKLLKNVPNSDHTSIQRFRKGVGGQRGLARGDPSYARGSDLFSALLFLCPLRRRGTQFWELVWAVFWALLGANPLPPTPFRNL